MKNTFKFLLIIASVVIIGFSMAACGDNDNGDNSISTSGSLTINGLAEYNDKYVYAEILNFENVGMKAASNFIDNDGFKAGKISNGSVTLKVWKGGIYSNPTSYNGDDTVTFSVTILSTAAMSSTNPNDPALIPLAYGSVNVIFNKGKGTGTFEKMED